MLNDTHFLLGFTSGEVALFNENASVIWSSKQSSSATTLKIIDNEVWWATYPSPTNCVFGKFSMDGVFMFKTNVTGETFVSGDRSIVSS